ncbi:MAG TPA: response regulator [Burkholderiales bacterium]|nr:response regulator [Burkholderiales bacterium]
MPSVAIVDDEEPIRKALRRLLRASGIEAESYASGQEFLDAIAERRPDCLVLDLHMSGMGGLEVLRSLQSVKHKVPTVIITAHDEPETREQCLAAGACAYLRKPLEDRLLLNAISAAVRTRAVPLKR